MPPVSPNLPDTPEARRYNQRKRWLGFADLALGFAFLLVLLLTGWSAACATSLSVPMRPAATPSPFCSTSLSSLAIGKLVAFAMEYYGFRLERRFHLSEQTLRSWL